jgi:hypothetical protein
LVSSWVRIIRCGVNVAGVVDAKRTTIKSDIRLMVSSLSKQSFVTVRTRYSPLAVGAVMASLRSHDSYSYSDVYGRGERAGYYDGGLRDVYDSELRRLRYDSCSTIPSSTK